MRTLALLLMVVCFFGCAGPRQYVPPVTLTPEAVQQAVFDAGILQWAECENGLYAAVDAQWLESEFPKLIAEAVKRQAAEKYSLGDNDCKDFARAARVAAAGWNHRAGRGGMALAVGELTYRKDGDYLNHRILIAIAAGGRAVFYEPQPPARVVTLSPDELLSVERGPLF